MRLELTSSPVTGEYFIQLNYITFIWCAVKESNLPSHNDKRFTVATASIYGITTHLNLGGELGIRTLYHSVNSRPHMPYVLPHHVIIARPYLFIFPIKIF